ncbi:MAG: shikimate dehydrogenase [Elusimicrobia bacterium RIFCSPLOWO2_01_FULL_59_12]|nr:MAG: shikimate dehydrogenase [Elusimicrobia bacterium RIFCSPLOWO2_01_FULL_59_12]
MKVSGNTQIFGIIGCPIEHSKSPVMHNAAFEALGLPAVYVPFSVRPEDLGKATLALRALNISGVNVTVPHKGAVIEFLDELDPIAKQIGAVNTIVLRNRKLYGYNTDGPGFMLSLRKDAHFEPLGKKAVVLGAGGAAAAVAMTLAGAGLRRLVIANRDKRRAEVLSKRVQKFFDREALAVGLDEVRALYWLIRESDLLVNATSVGLNPKDRLNLNPNSFHPKLLVFDVVSQETALVKAARKKGLKAIDGVGMLVSQGARSFEIFTGKRAPFRVMKTAVEQAIKYHR